MAALLVAAFAGCASLPQQPSISSADIDWVLGGANRPAAPDTAPVETLASLLHVNAAMRRFAVEATRDSGLIQDRVRALSAALGPNGLNLRYDPGATLTAEQAFEQRRVNCLSYTLLFVALAREVGIPANFNEVDIPPIWDAGDDRTFLLYRHVNARIDLFWPTFQIVDVSGEEYDPAFDQRLIPDQDLLAQFYNNRAVELRLAQHDEQALRYELRALAEAPNAGYLWTNLAGLYLLIDQPRAGRIAITRALALDPGDQLGYDTAAKIYDQLGERRLATYFHERARDFLEQNPYHHYQLAIAALRDHRQQVAYDEVRRAISLYPHEHRFFFLLAVVLQDLGETKLADDSMQAALELAHDPAQQERYRNKFALLTKRG